VSFAIAYYLLILFMIELLGLTPINAFKVKRWLTFSAQLLKDDISIFHCRMYASAGLKAPRPLTKATF